MDLGARLLAHSQKPAHTACQLPELRLLPYVSGFKDA